MNTLGQLRFWQTNQKSQKKWTSIFLVIGSSQIAMKMSNLMCYCYSLSCYTLEYGLYILHWRFSCWIHHQNLSKSYQLCLLASFYQDSTSLTPKCCVEYEDMVDNYSCNYNEETLNFHTIYKQVLHNGYRKVLATLI